ncbi:TetR/AcrR family transcriptional regulator [Actinoplanes couchii]|uniref:TetR family transcriptional regulator n=1 Tax=Actinoplanes couchii TaxID=403638 RepID=A0ABQ3XRX2_9ACTN|nr:TetR/AcrR family transcriptional regulator C-terminal domain-containing protein [Actinoplanes couchii]MDR6318743.1 AcrR family transcriptional regulator [Actinoplanes couchii]GID61271.1 TetR family transcriptional regulator [Actinoplanes couchii]
MSVNGNGRVVRSRRERPAKAALTRQGIIETALAILHAEGLGKVTMRRIATDLDTGHASLYVYVRDAEDLHAQILDALLAPVVAADPPAGDWRDRVKALLFGYRDVLHARPEIARMALSTQPSGPHFTALVEALLKELHAGGASDRAAAWGVDLLLLGQTATAVEQSTPKPARHATADVDAITATIAGVDPAAAPHITRLGAELVSGTPAERADFAVDVILDGILAA